MLRKPLAIPGRTPSVVASRALTLFLASVALPFPASGADLVGVTLFETGLIRYEHRLDSMDDVHLRVPRRDIDDVLKSLTLHGDGITGARIRLSGSAAVEDAFTALPFGPEAIGNPEAMLARLQGVTIRANSDGQQLEGVVLGVERPGPGCEAPCPARLLLKEEDGTLRRAVLETDLRFSIEDPDLRRHLARAIEAMRDRNTEGHDIRIEISGEGPAGLSWTGTTPVWKTAWRAFLREDGAAEASAWAVIENAGPADWRGVRLTLASGTPRGISANLHGRVWQPRETLSSAPPSRSDLRRAFMAGESAMDMSESFALSAAPAPIQPGAVGTEDGFDASFTFPEPIDLDAGQMLSMPFAGGTLPARSLALWTGRGGSGAGQPDRILRIRNDLPVRLPGGVMTLSGGDGHLGDAVMPVLMPGQEEEIAFGREAGLTMTETLHQLSTTRRLRAGGGVLRISTEERRAIRYRIEAAEGVTRDIDIHHALAPGWRQQTVSGAGIRAEDATGSGRRLTLAATVTGGETVEIDVIETREGGETIRIDRVSRDVLETHVEGEMPAADRRWLEEAIALRQALDEAEAAAAELVRARGEISQEQARLSRLLQTVRSNSDAHARFLASLLEAEDALNRNMVETEAARAAASAAERRFQAHLRSDP